VRTETHAALSGLNPYYTLHVRQDFADLFVRFKGKSLLQDTTRLEEG
jgi:hypothetical protein